MPIDVTLDPISAEARELESLNAFSPIEVIVPGMTSDVSEPPRRALLPMEVTV